MPARPEKIDRPARHGEVDLLKQWDGKDLRALFDFQESPAPQDRTPVGIGHAIHQSGVLPALFNLVSRHAIVGTRIGGRNENFSVETYSAHGIIGVGKTLYASSEGRYNLLLVSRENLGGKAFQDYEPVMESQPPYEKYTLPQAVVITDPQVIVEGHPVWISWGEQTLLGESKEFDWKGKGRVEDPTAVYRALQAVSGDVFEYAGRDNELKSLIDDVLTVESQLQAAGWGKREDTDF